MILRSAPLLLGGSDSRAAFGRSRWLRPCKLTFCSRGHGCASVRGRLSTHQCIGVEPFANDLDCGRRVVLSRAAPTLRSVETHRRAVRSLEERVCARSKRADRPLPTRRPSRKTGLGHRVSRASRDVRGPLCEAFSCQVVSESGLGGLAKIL